MPHRTPSGVFVYALPRFCRRKNFTTHTHAAPPHARTFGMKKKNNRATMPLPTLPHITLDARLPLYLLVDVDLLRIVGYTLPHRRLRARCCLPRLPPHSPYASAHILFVHYRLPRPFFALCVYSFTCRRRPTRTTTPYLTLPWAGRITRMTPPARRTAMRHFLACIYSAPIFYHYILSATTRLLRTPHYVVALTALSRLSPRWGIRANIFRSLPPRRCLSVATLQRAPRCLPALPSKALPRSIYKTPCVCVTVTRAARSPGATAFMYALPLPRGFSTRARFRTRSRKMDITLYFYTQRQLKGD